MYILIQILALFESSAHPQYSPERAAASLVFLDNIIRALSLTYLDANDPDVSIFAQRSVPTVSDTSSADSASKETTHGPPQHDRKCSCIHPNTTLPHDHFASSRSYPLPWDPSWSAAEVRKEECRRLCWSALNLVAGYTSQCSAFNTEPPDLFLSDPANVRPPHGSSLRITY